MSLCHARKNPVTLGHFLSDKRKHKKFEKAISFDYEKRTLLYTAK